MPTRLMRNIRTGKVAVYDEALIADGRWVEVKDDAAPAPKPSANDDVAVKDEVTVTLTKGAKDEGKQRKA